MDALHAKEAVGHCAARVARGGYQHVDRTLLPPLPDEVGQQARHEPRPHVLERQGGAVIEFETVNIIAYVHQRHVECERVVHDAVQGIGLHVLSEESIGYRAGCFLERKRVDAVEKLRGQGGDALGHEQSPVVGQTFCHGFFE